MRLLKGLKGAGGAARLLDLCTSEELPRTIRDFLLAVYGRFPKPQRGHTTLDESCEAVPNEGTAIAGVAAPPSAAPEGCQLPGNEV